MEKLAETEQPLPSNKEIGNVVINYIGKEKPLDAIPITLSDRKTYLLTNIIRSVGSSKLILQDLNGNALKELADFGSVNATIAANNNTIYAFSQSRNYPMIYVFDKETLKLKWKEKFESFVSGVSCNDNKMFTFNSDNGSAQQRDMVGTLISSTKIKEDNINPALVYSASDGFHYLEESKYAMIRKYIKECETKFGKEFMDLNYYIESVAFDESTQTFYVALRNIIIVMRKNQIEGIMYLPDKSIINLSVDSITKSLIISSSNWPEIDKVYSSEKGGSLEILPISMVLDRIKSSEAFLISRNQDNSIIDESNGNFDKTIADSNNENAQEKSRDDLNKPEEGRARLNDSMTFEQYAITMHEGNIGAFSIFKDMPKDDYILLNFLDEYGVRGVKLWCLYDKCCNGVYDIFRTTMLMIGDRCFSQKDIDDNLNPDNDFFIPFIADENIEELMKETWDDFCNRNIDIFAKRLKEFRELAAKRHNSHK